MKRDTYIYANRHMYICKQTHIYMKRDTHIYRNRRIKKRSDDSLSYFRFDKYPRHIWKKGPVYMKRDIYI